MSRARSAPVQARIPGRTAPSGRVPRACCAALVMVMALPCATTAGESAPRPAHGASAAAPCAPPIAG